MRQAFILLLISFALASGQDRSDLRIAPSHPVRGDSLTFLYRPASEFAPARGESVVVEILAAGATPRVYDVTLARSAGAYEASWTSPSDAEALVVRVAVGERIDDRRGEGWAVALRATNGDAIPGAHAWLSRAGSPGGLHGFRASIMGSTPLFDLSADRGEIPGNSEWQAAVAERDPHVRWSELSSYLERHLFPADEASVQVLVRSAIAAKEWDAADELIHRQARKEPLWLISLAEGMMNANVMLDRASVLAKESVNAARNWDPARKPALLSLREFRNQRASEVPLALRTYARSLVKLGYPALAEKVYAEAFELLDGRDPDVRSEYVAVLRSLEKQSKAEEIERTFAR
ncbi:MAG: hypothetical protein MUE68_06830 [Bacteroidetes bacterium]|nr:hypothetical protein [Bacteroidota bacterium]